MYKRVLFILAVVLFFLNCGQRADLIIKLLPIPLPPAEVKISQRGKLLLLNLTYPEKFKNGDIFNKLDKIEIIGYFKYKDDKDTKYKPKKLYTKENIGFNKENKTLIKLELPDKTGEILFSIISFYKKYSNKTKTQTFGFIKNYPYPILHKPKLTEKGVELSWSSKNSFPFYALYKNNFNKSYKIFEGTKNSFTDTEVEYDKEIKYSITGISKKEPLIETALSKKMKILPKDNFPPPQVQNIDFLYTSKNKVLIKWDKVKAKDLKGYIIYYSFNKKIFKKYNKEPITENQIIIDSPPKRKKLFVYIRSTDNSNNESEKSEIIIIK